MTDELMNTNATRADGFDDDGTENDFVRVIQGEKISFTNESVWVNADDEEVAPDRELVVVDIARVLQKWIDKAPVHTQFLASGEQIDVKQLNEECSREEWSEDLNGKPRGPWQVQHVVYMVDMETMARFTYPTSTVGGSIAITDLKDAVRLMRKFKGPGVYPVVTLADKFMNTKFGGRQRPLFIIKNWISFGPDGALPPAADNKALPKATPAAPSGAHVVAEPTLREEMGDDSIPF
jgi:hypothetical protein